MESTAPAASDSNNMDDIQYLLHLECIKRLIDERKDLQRQVEEQTGIYADAKREYQREFARLAKFQKQVLLCQAQQSPHSHLNDNQVTDTKLKLQKASAILSNKNRATTLDAGTLQQCKEQLQQQHHQPREQLTQHQHNIATNYETVKVVSATLESVKSNFEKATLLALDQYSKEMQSP